MKIPAHTSPDSSAALTNGSGAAAILSAGVACLALGILAIAGDKWAAVKVLLVFYKPTGPLSGVTTVAILVWLVTWAILDLLWRKRTIAVARTSAVAFVLLNPRNAMAAGA